VSYDSEIALALLGVFVAGVERGAEAAFGLGDEAFDVPAVAVDAAKEAVEHLAAVFGFGFLAFEAARVERDDGGTDAEFVTAKGVSIFGVVGLVGEYAVKVDVFGRFGERGNEEGHVIARAAGCDGSGDEVGMVVTHDGQFGPVPLGEDASLAAPVQVMGAGVPRFESGRVDGALGPFVQQIQGSCALEYSVKQGVESPFFSSRFSAWQRVE
jgi:hypothetical protein